MFTSGHLLSRRTIAVLTFSLHKCSWATNILTEKQWILPMLQMFSEDTCSKGKIDILHKHSQNEISLHGRIVSSGLTNVFKRLTFPNIIIFCSYKLSQRCQSGTLLSKRTIFQWTLLLTTVIKVKILSEMQKNVVFISCKFS